MALYKDLYRRKCRSLIQRNEVRERVDIGLDNFQQTADLVVKIQDRMKMVHSRQNNYVDMGKRELKFSVGDYFFVTIAHMKRVMQFGKKKKIRPRFIEPFEILERAVALAYKVALPPNLAGVQNVFHISLLCMYMSNPLHVQNYEPLQLTPNLSYEEKPMQILGRRERKLRNKFIKMVKEKWLNHPDEEATWETEADMRSRYPDLFGKY
ncbi:uncharacterized protein LOC142523879 [Primulina tabacum]|uniref:uncharacterized protein LOC142523879 n=1 Tax=Primulina tabacum TaxID=48773 RepID=UPI003F59D291